MPQHKSGKESIVLLPEVDGGCDRTKGLRKQRSSKLLQKSRTR